MPHYVIRLPSGERFTAAAAEPLLPAAQRAGWLVRFGCRNGNCGACVAQLLQGTVEPLGPQRGVAPGEILLCRTCASSDLTIGLSTSPIPGSAAQQRRSFVTLVAQRPLASDRWELRWQLPAGRQPVVREGQLARWESPDGPIVARIDIASSRGRVLVALADRAGAPTPPLRGWLEWPLGSGDLPAASTAEEVL